MTVPSVTKAELARSIYGGQAVVKVSPFGFNGSEFPLTAHVTGKLLYGTREIVPWVIRVPDTVAPKSEFSIEVRMVVGPQIAQYVSNAIVAGSSAEFGLNRLEITLTSPDGVSAPLPKPVSVRCFRGIEVSRTLAATMNGTVKPAGEAT